MSERSPAIRALVMSRVSCGVCFACGVVNAVLITYLVSTGMYTLSATQVAWLLALPMALMVMATRCLFALLRVTRRTAQEEPSESAQRPEHRLAPGLRKPVSLSAANGVTTLEAVLQSIPFFNDLSEAHLREVIRAGRSLAMEANESYLLNNPWGLGARAWEACQERRSQA